MSTSFKGSRYEATCYKIRQDVYCTYKHNIEERSRDHFCCGESITISFSECVSVALVIKYAKRLRLSLLSSVAGLAVQNFSALSHKRDD